MYLAYVDESFNKKLFYMAALIATPEQVQSLTDELDEYVLELSERYPTIAAREELHGHEIFHGKSGWQRLYPRQQVRVFMDVFDIIADSGVKIAVRGLDIEAQKQKYRDPYPPYTVVLTKILEKVQSLSKAADSLALVICDEYHEDDRHRKLLANYRQWSTPTSTSMKLDRIIDTIHFTPSHESRMIQATDMVAFIRLRRSIASGRDSREVAAMTKLWDKIAKCVVVDYVWRP